MEEPSFIKNWQKIYFISLDQEFNIHENIINQIINNYKDDNIDFHVAYVPHERGYDYEEYLFKIHTYLKKKLEELEKLNKLEMSIVYNKNNDTYNNTTMKIWENKNNRNNNYLIIQQYSRSLTDNEIQLENRKVRLGDKGKYKYDNDERVFEEFTSLNMFPFDEWLLRGFLSSVAGESLYDNKSLGNGGVYYQFVYKYSEEEAPTLQRKFEKYEHADVPYDKFRIELNKDDGKIKSEEPYKFPTFITDRTAQKIARFANKNVIRSVINTGNAISNIFKKKTNKAEEAAEEAAPAVSEENTEKGAEGGKTRKHRKRKMRSSKRKANKKGRKSRKKNSSSRKKK